MYIDFCVPIGVFLVLSEENKILSKLEKDISTATEMTADRMKMNVNIPR